MTGERVQKLESIGIVWQVNNWMERFNDLNKFINEVSHFKCCWVVWELNIFIWNLETA